MNVKFKGIVKHCQINELDKSQGFVNKFLIYQPEKKNEFDELLAKEQFIEVSYFSKELKKMHLPTDWINKRVEINAYLNSNLYISSPNKQNYILNLNLKTIVIF
jgi:hypothetical protein